MQNAEVVIIPEPLMAQGFLVNGGFLWLLITVYKNLNISHFYSLG